MFYKIFSIQIIFRVLLLFATSILLAYLLLHTHLWFSIAGVLLLTAGEIISLISYINGITGDLNRFIDTIKYQDNNLIFPEQMKTGRLRRLYASFNEVISYQRNVTLEKESYFQLFRVILERAKFGIILVPVDPVSGIDPHCRITFINESAFGLLKIPMCQNWRILMKYAPGFVSVVNSMPQGGKKLFDLHQGGKRIQLSLEALPVRVHSLEHLLLTFQDLKEEIEQKEIEAWSRLIRVLSHEILNSITPINSLADTLRLMIEDDPGEAGSRKKDIQAAVNTIKRRTDGLMEFVKDYRLVAELPSPMPAPCGVKDLLDHVKLLMSPVADENNIRIELNEVLSGDTISLDRKLIEQVLINLISNSIWAVQEVTAGKIVLSAGQKEEHYLIQVIDNGRGIANEDLDKIFVPFFTTREKGSGIGLSISKNIMKRHGGNLEVSSTEGKGTVFSLVFKP